MADPVRIEASPFGPLLRSWRTARGQSQLALGLCANVSTRHVSYLETGRARPSREMVLMLAQALDVPLRERNGLLVAAGYAPLYRETPLDAPALGPVRDALSFILAATEPNPTFIVNRRYDLIDANASARWILSTFSVDPIPPPGAACNLARRLIDARGMRPFLRNGDEVVRKVLGRLRRDLGGVHARDAVDQELLDEIEPVWRRLEPAPATDDALPLLVGLRLQRDELALNLFTTIATLGTPLDVTLQELRIESLFAADEPTKQALARRSAAA